MKTVQDVLPPDPAAAVIGFKRDAEKALPGRIARVVLFGSRARGDARRGSDYDVAVFVRGVDGRTARRDIRHTLCDAAYDYMLRGFSISPYVLPAEELGHEPSSELVENITRDGVLVP